MREMKESGVEWIGEIPRDWELVKLKNYYKFEKGINAAVYTKDYIGLNIGEFPVYSGQTENNGIMGYIKSFDYEIQECLFTTTVGAKVMTPKILRGKFNLSQNCLIMKRYTTCCNTFMFYMLLPLFDYEKSLIPSYMQPSLRIDDLRRYTFYIPSISTQHRIADYLDTKCSKIDTIIAREQAVIEKLKEYKLSVITEAVTKGLNPNVPMKDSGIEWIGEIPENWNIVKVKNVSNFVTDGAHVSPEIENGIYDFISTVNIEQDSIIFEGCLKTSEKSYRLLVSSGCKPQIEDILISKDGTVGRTVVVKTSHEFVISSSLVIIRPDKDIILSEFLNYNLQNKIVQENLKMIMHGAGLRRVSVHKNKNLPVILPDMFVQQQIADYLDNKCAKIGSAILCKQAVVEKLTEYKKSLIYEVVTGKKEV